MRRTGLLGRADRLPRVAHLLCRNPRAGSESKERDADQYDVIVQTATQGRTTPADIEQLFARGRGDAMVPLGSLITVREAVSPRELNHFNQRRSVSITANLAPGYALGEALQFMDDTARQLLPSGYATDLNGISREFRASSGALGLVFVLALLFIFLVAG